MMRLEMNNMRSFCFNDRPHATHPKELPALMPLRPGDACVSLYVEVTVGSFLQDQRCRVSSVVQLPLLRSAAACNS